MEKPPEKYEKPSVKLLPAVSITVGNTAVGKAFRRLKTAGKTFYRWFYKTAGKSLTLPVVYETAGKILTLPAVYKIAGKILTHFAGGI